MLPKKQAEVLFEPKKGKLALIVYDNKNANDKSAIKSECKADSTNLIGKTTQFFIDVDS